MGHTLVGELLGEDNNVGHEKKKKFAKLYKIEKMNKF